jgi:hypothetical protein
MQGRDFKEFVELLNANGVEYLVVGDVPDRRRRADLQSLEDPPTN